MNKIRFNAKLLIILGTLLILVTIGQSLIEYRSSRATILDLFKSQSEILISSIAQAGEKGLIAYQSLQEQVISKLQISAKLIDGFLQLNKLDQSQLNRIAQDNDLSEIIIFDSRARIMNSYPKANGAELDSTFKNNILNHFIEGDTNYKVPGFINGPITGDKLFAVLYKNHNDNIILVGADATGLQDLRRAFGTGSIIEDLSRNTGVRYAGIINAEMIIAASQNFPIDQMDDWYDTGIRAIDSISTRLRTLSIDSDNTENVFEAQGPFYVADQYYGDIVIGLDTNVLDSLSDKLKRDVFWHSILGLLITLIAVSGIFVWNNYRVIAQRYDEIKGEVQKLEADKAIKARLASMGELAGGVAHEIRNPLNAIRVIIQRLQREFVPASDKDEYLELTNIVKRETDRINESIEQFLKMARPPALQKTAGNLNDCLEHVLELFAARALQKNIIINKDLKTLPMMNFDSQLCRQAILNILENALDAIPAGGDIAIKTYVKSKKIYIEISDNGPGISDELKSRIFDMYFTTKDSGTGMGLPSVLMTVKEHGGTVDVLDNPGGGAIFRLEFPIE